MMLKALFNRRGFVMPSTVMLIAVITVLGFTAAFLVQSQAAMGLRFTNRENALHYAEAGLNKYLWHLNKESKYYERTVFGPEEAAPETVTAYHNGFYYLQVVPPSETAPMVLVRSTGWTAADPGNMVTVEASVHKKQFNQYAYFSNDDGPNIWWIDGERCYGPYHTNATLRVRGRPIFYGKVTYGDSIVYWSGANPDFREGTEQVAPLVKPPNNAQLKYQAQLNGYYYRDRTSILLNSNGTITTRNPNRNGGNAENRPLPANGVIYVDGDTGSDRNSANKFLPTRGNAFVSGSLRGRLTIAAVNDIYITGRDPTNYTFSAAAVTGGISYAATTFNELYKEGELVGYQAVGDDMLGLVANKNVYILGFDWFTALSGAARNVAPDNITIHATVFAVNDGFGYESYDLYNKNTIFLRGSLIQEIRRPVGIIGGTGYDKNYAHDSRMAYDTPPSFLEPVNAGWEIVTWRLAGDPAIP